ncbi:phospholipase D delta [Selaginella moellendorffii]|uniref:phospholipase D delta n=1 Tax=Selaginella moellendorffii TaxID=88036 RepID=UPI000D1CBB07|nr:phospholipase D delta [Selaginella moellendorffii]|eukprot:XP_024528962.1 phospholipase D delta [Selaginella moellendorffii]
MAAEESARIAPPQGLRSQSSVAKQHHRHLRRHGSHELEDEELENEADLETVEEEKSNLLLYGKLEVGIGDCKNLVFRGPLTDCVRMRIPMSCNPKVSKKTRYPKRGLYVVLSIGGARLGRTRISKKPSWNEQLSIHVSHFATEVVLTVKDDGLLFGPHVLGRVRIPAEEVLSKKPIEGWFPLLSRGRQKQDTQLNLFIKYTPVEEDRNYIEGVGPGIGVEKVYFPLRTGCRVRLYQDAHAEVPPLKPISLDNGQEFVRQCCWEDLCRAIVDAHHIVYIIGWAVFHRTRLVRTGHKDLPDLTLGELLKQKSAEGVRVLLLVWDDKTSHRTRFFKIDGVMGTHDEDTKKYFKHSAVKCVLSPRYGDNKLSWFRQKIVGTLYTHHQKLVIADTQGPGQTRKITSFLGGLDLCDGRYDTQKHSLFNTLTTIHKDDCYNAMFSATAESGGPRQPWHDQHCMLEGPAAYDCLKNFEQRWLKSSNWHDDELVQISRISWILGPIKEHPEEDKALLVSQHDDPETWHAQVFRSIDSGSVKGFPKSALGAEVEHLICGKNIAIDKSIHAAYVERIRSARHFIYIENQYFLGSSYAWPDYKNAGATHLIPMEIALKIDANIRKRKRFAVYVLVPMWPEGAPDSASGQEILYFQAQTMETMYRVVAKALADTGLDKEYHPRDYLNFYCLGNREKRNHEPEKPPPEKSKQHTVQENGRFLIYVHAKSMIVDDEYVIIGSANINQRSMDGCRDTEIAMGAFQPNYTWKQQQKHPRGQVYGHRISLWAEHLACVEDCFEDPESVETVRRVNHLAEENWKQYVGEEVVDMQGHLMPYPVEVTPEGKLEPLQGFENFPDLGGKVLGTPHAQLPDQLTS